MNKIKKIIAFLLTAILVMSTSAFTAFAAEATNSPKLSMVVGNYYVENGQEYFGFNSTTAIKNKNECVSAKAGDKISIAFILSGVDSAKEISLDMLYNTSEKYLTPGYYQMNKRNYPWTDMTTSTDDGSDDNSTFLLANDHSIGNGWTSMGKIVTLSNGSNNKSRVMLTEFTSDFTDVAIPNSSDFECYDAKSGTTKTIKVNGAVLGIFGFNVVKDIDNIYDVFEMNQNEDLTYIEKGTDTNKTKYTYNNINFEAGETSSWCNHDANNKNTLTDCEKGLYCSVCNEELIAPASHTYKEVVTPPTCTKQGYTTHTCSTCGKTYKDNYTDATGHSYGEWYTNNNGTHSKDCNENDDTITENCTYSSVVTDPTCTEKGYTTYTCIKCGYEYIDNYVNANGHTWTIKTQHSDCTEWICSVCNEEKVTDNNESGPVKPDPIPTPGSDENSTHHYESIVTEPTCTERGYTTIRCTDEGCDEQKITDYTDALGHSYVYTSNGDHATHTVTCSRVNAGTPCDYQEQANCNFDETGHCTYCNQTGLYDITAKVVVMEDQDNSHSHNYGVANVKIKINNETVATTNDSGSFTVTDLEPGTYELTLDYEYGYDRTVTVTVAGSDINYEGNIPLITCNFQKDNLINLKDTIKFYEAMNNKDFVADINKDGDINVYDLKIMNKIKGFVELTPDVYENINF